MLKLNLLRHDTLVNLLLGCMKMPSLTGTTSILFFSGFLNEFQGFIPGMQQRKRPGRLFHGRRKKGPQALMAEHFGTGKNVVLPFPSAREEPYRTFRLGQRFFHLSHRFRQAEVALPTVTAFTSESYIFAKLV